MLYGEYTMPYNIRIVSTYPPRRCGIGTFSRDLANVIEHFTGEVGRIRLSDEMAKYCLGFAATYRIC